MGDNAELKNLTARVEQLEAIMAVSYTHLTLPTMAVV